MKNSTFFKIALLIILTTICLYTLLPKYAIKNVRYQNTFLTDKFSNSPTVTYETALIRINRLTGQIDQFSAHTSYLQEKEEYIQKWVPFSNEMEK